MARRILQRDVSPILAAAEHWIRTCLVEDGSLFLQDSRWTADLVDDVYRAFVDHPDFGEDDFMTKLKGQMKTSSPFAQQLMGEMLWALLLFPSNMKARTKRQQISEIWALSRQQLNEQDPLLTDSVLAGIGSGGPGFNNYRPNELKFLISLVRDLKQKNESERRYILNDYAAFFDWIDSAPRKGSRQFRHMLRYFAFPDRVERISSNNDRRKILEAFASGSRREVTDWNDRQLDDKLAELRTRLQSERPSAVLDFYDTPLKELWSGERKIRTLGGEVTVTVPADDEESEDQQLVSVGAKTIEARKSIQIQSKLARIGAIMGFKVWIPRSDRGRVRELVPEKEQAAF